jgi:hypothetical protein
VADVVEEIARLYGFPRIPEHHLADPLPPQHGNLALEREETAETQGGWACKNLTHRLAPN